MRVCKKYSRKKRLQCLRFCPQLHNTTGPAPHLSRLRAPNLRRKLLNLVSGETKQVQQVQNALAVQPCVGLHLHHRLRVPGNTQSRRSHHQKVVRAIAYGNDLGKVNTLLAGNLDQEVALPLFAYDKSLDLTRKLTGIINDHLVGMRVVNAQLSSQPARKGKESTRKHCGLHTEAL
ncbi:hypothetical protein CI238_08727 [Colletotrichum incanum]|uniref:Uncharacterized protein n=1 Tax=Colletotrichum incanum TaxID=1573173 RepID=A0A162Q148_COLIC|nr:hypothetical protein CI238_08727 [Colletotrichum incanum]